MQAQIRFIHVKDIESTMGIDGYTVAYIRTEDCVYFAWAEKCVEDRYEKEVGRFYSTQRLKEITDDMIEHADEMKVWVDFHSMCGVVSLAYFTEGLDRVFSDQHVGNMTLFDYKHSFISAILKSIVVKQEF